MRRSLGLMLALALFVQLFAPAYVRAEEPGAPRQGTITAERLNLREGAGTAYAVIGSAVLGETVSILEEQDEWFRVRLADGRTGWVAAKYVRVGEAAATAPARDEETRAAPSPGAEPAPAEKQRGGGSIVRGVLKWGSFFGALACGGLAYNEHSLGNDSYDQYEAMVLEEGRTAAEAEFRRQEAIDHDEKAQTFLIAGSALFGAFLIQQFFFGGGGDDGDRSEASDVGNAAVPGRFEASTLDDASGSDRFGRIEFGAAARGFRAGLVLARF